jgi:HNH endonuclease
MTERICSVDQCGKRLVARGLCSGHWTRWRKYGDPLGSAAPRFPTECTVEGCSQPHYGRGWCQKHYSRVRATGTTEKIDRRSDPQPRFWAKVMKTDTCWLWLGATNDLGYGQIINRSRSSYVHRLSYEWANGPIPDGMMIDHICQVPACVNPDHLRLATRKQNAEHHQGPTRASTTRVRGVYQQGGSYIVQVTHNRQRYSGGSYKTLIEAEAAAKHLRNELHTRNDRDRWPVSV